MPANRCAGYTHTDHGETEAVRTRAIPFQILPPSGSSPAGLNSSGVRRSSRPACLGLRRMDPADLPAVTGAGPRAGRRMSAGLSAPRPVRLMRLSPFMANSGIRWRECSTRRCAPAPRGRRSGPGFPLMGKQRARVLLFPLDLPGGGDLPGGCRMRIPEPAGITADGALADPGPAMARLRMFPGAPDVSGSPRIRHVKPENALRGLPVAPGRRDPSGGLPPHVHGIGGRHPAPDAGHRR